MRHRRPFCLPADVFGAPPKLRVCTCPGLCELHDRAAEHERAFDPDALEAPTRELPERPPPGWGRS